MNRCGILAGALAVLAAPLDAAPAGPVPPGVPAASVPDQPWYPKGYRDFRIAAADEIATFPRESWTLMQRAEYDLGLCDDKYRDRAGQYAELALEVARLGSEMKRLGYPAGVFEQPLLDYERDGLASLKLPAAAQEAAAAGSSAPDRLSALAAQMESRRQRAQTGMPIVYRGCSSASVAVAASRRRRFGALRGSPGVAIEMSPPGGHLWLLNGFAFRVCERKSGNPWDHIACGWNEYSAGAGAQVSGRYIYEARWPDGTVRRGARILEFDADGSNRAIRFDRD